MSRILALVAAAVLTLPAAALAKVPTGPSGSAFYTPPALASGSAHGDIIRARTITGSRAVPGAARTSLVLYRSTSVRGKRIAVSGLVSVPKGKAPASGWPVISWAHGTTGLADQCAPSTSGIYSSYVRGVFSTWIRNHYAVVQTDYEGLGTPGIHPYLIGKSEGRGTLDIVRAARRLNSAIGRRLIITGHSQGGHAALWAAALAPSWTPELRVRGTVAFAPASHIAEQAKLLSGLTAPSGLTALAASILRGIDVAQPSLNVANLLSDQARALYPLTATKCLGALAQSDSYGGLPPSSLIRGGANIAPVTAALSANDPEDLRIRTPVRVEQGKADTTVFPAFTDQLVSAYRTRHNPVSYKTYPGVDHGHIPTAAAGDATAWIKQKLGS